MSEKGYAAVCSNDVVVIWAGCERGRGEGGGCTFSLQLVRVSISERVDTLVHANTVIELVLLKVCTLARAQGVLQLTKVPRLPGIKGTENMASVYLQDYRTPFAM